MHTKVNFKKVTFLLWRKVTFSFWVDTIIGLDNKYSITKSKFQTNHKIQMSNFLFLNFELGFINNGFTNNN